MQRIVPNVWCHGNADDIGRFYAAVLPDTSAEVVASYPTEDVPDFQRELAGQPLVVDVTVGGYRIRLINAGGEFRPTPALSFMVNMDPMMFSGGEEEARARITSMWAAFSDGGEVRLPLGEYPHSKLYGWVEDRFGVNWQLMLADPAGGRRPILIPQLLFTGAAAQARQAIDLYTGLFPGSAPGMLVPRPGDDEGVLFAEFTLAEQQFSAMDGGAAHDFTFTPGVSLEFDCVDQDEIDTLWAALSAVPDAEQCGWLVDRFGVSWQIVPENMGELMEHSGAYQRMLDMKKIIIADL
ncbi:VOC family protein [Tessaracoccus antarcticus]|uniref:VOC family protein n=1 Tax=Tessaracoccus antarcticus TaxID=2479848 RepID=A0A3M0G8U4_9ACTN|nr:VOC family protein [Tessaracoccus antarcticus]RMB61461.1 VOC family protein [Tessaracoccus antarcticus]